jgi:hypothetical protein
MNLVRTLSRGAAAAALVPLLLVVSSRVTAADPGAPAVSGKAVTLEAVPGSPVKRVVLSAKAAERLDVKTGTVGEQVIVPTHMVGAIVADPSAAGATSPPRSTASAGSDDGSRAPGDLWVRVALSPPEWNRLAKDKPARILPLETRAPLPAELFAAPTGGPPLESAKSGMLTVFYALPRGGGGLALGDRVRAELQLEGGTEKQKVVPYSAVYYDAKGDAWVYVTTAPLAFMRQRITVERVAGDLAVLASGPEVGTRVATVGVSLLYGAEIFGK